MKIFRKIIIGLIVAGLILSFRGKKQSNILSSFIKNLPFPNSELIKGTQDINFFAFPTIPPEKVDALIQKSGEAIEKSPLSEPLQDLKEQVEQIINQTNQQIKELPAKQIKVIQREVCKQWLGDEIIISTTSGETNGGN